VHDVVDDTVLLAADIPREVPRPLVFVEAVDVTLRDVDGTVVQSWDTVLHPLGHRLHRAAGMSHPDGRGRPEALTVPNRAHHGQAVGRFGEHPVVLVFEFGTLGRGQQFVAGLPGGLVRAVRVGRVVHVEVGELVDRPLLAVRVVLSELLRVGDDWLVVVRADTVGVPVGPVVHRVVLVPEDGAVRADEEALCLLAGDVLVVLEQRVVGDIDRAVCQFVQRLGHRVLVFDRRHREVYVEFFAQLARPDVRRDGDFLALDGAVLGDDGLHPIAVHLDVLRPGVRDELRALLHRLPGQRIAGDDARNLSVGG